VKQQTADFVDDVGAALAILTDPKMSDEKARRNALTLISSALKGQENLEFLCQNMALAVRQFALLPRNTPPSVYDEILGKSCVRLGTFVFPLLSTRRLTPAERPAARPLALLLEGARVAFHGAARKPRPDRLGLTCATNGRISTFKASHGE
jgi:hypothetical protein